MQRTETKQRNTSGVGAGVGASHIHNGIPQVHSKSGDCGGAGATSSSSLSKNEESAARSSLPKEELVLSTAS